MSRAALAFPLLAALLLAAPCLAQTGTAPGASAQAPPYSLAEPSYEAETPILLGTFLESSGGTEPADRTIGAMPRPIPIVTDPARNQPEMPRIEPIMSATPEK